MGFTIGCHHPIMHNSHPSFPHAEGKYLPPALRAAAAAAAAATPGAAESAADERLMRRVRGLLNRISESSLPKVAAELAALFATEGRRTVCHAINAELLSVRRSAFI